MYGYVLFVVLEASLLVATCYAAPVQSDTQAMKYLSQYGYFNLQGRSLSSGDIISTDTMKEAISEFQAFAGLKVTGELDRETVETMSLPRCGVKDKVGSTINSRSKRYALQGSRWKVREVTYKISKYPTNLAKRKVDPEIERGFKVWSDVSGLNIVKGTENNVHIDIRFEKGEHGDGDPFDGPSGTLAHAYFPVYGGDAHFDDTEDWSVNSYRGTNLFQVAAHEFGHSLGLSHSDVKTALMAPFYRGYEPNFRLDPDDIDGIQALYGKPSSKPNLVPGSTTSTESPKPGNAELCSDSSVDTIFTTAEGVTYAFKGEYYWELTDNGLTSGYPQLISENWQGLPGNIEAAFTDYQGKTYFFKGSECWRFVGSRMDGNYPKKISQEFIGIPDNVNAALVWSRNRNIFFFKGTRYWRYDPLKTPHVETTYPRPIANWKGIPDNLDAAVEYTNGYIYFFKKGLYYRFNDGSFSVEETIPAYPRSIGSWWFDCKNISSNGSPGDDNNQVPDDGRTGEASSSGILSYRTNLLGIIMASFLVFTWSRSS